MNRRIGWLSLCGALLAAALCGCASVPREEAAAFDFVQITDTHFGGDDHEARTRKAVDAINHLPMPIACVVHTGDITADRLSDPRTVGVATSILATLRVPVHYLPGNHDILRRKVAATVGVYTNAFGPLAARAEYHGVVFLFLYDEPLRKAVTVEGYDPLAWLDAALRQAGRKPVLVFIHTPPVDDFYDNRVHPGWPEEIRQRFTQMINSANVKGVIAGHFHRDELHWLGNVPLYVSSSIASYWGRQASFRIYEYDHGRLSYRSVYLE
jgi:3',5'-cyclic-AMP phosphodiesterase